MSLYSVLMKYLVERKFSLDSDSFKSGEKNKECVYLDLLFVFNRHNASICSGFGLEIYFYLCLPVHRFENQ